MRPFSVFLLCTFLLYGCAEAIGDNLEASSIGSPCTDSIDCGADLQCRQGSCIEPVVSGDAGDQGDDDGVEIDGGPQDNAAPELTIISPSGGETFLSSEAVMVVATVQDDHDASEVLSAEFSSNLDGDLGQIGVQNGQASKLLNGLSGGSHTITVRVVDSGGLEASDSISFIIDAPPGPPEVLILPENPGTLDDLTVELTTASQDTNRASEELDYEYRWNRNGAHQDELSGPFVPSSETAKGDLWQVRVMAFDGSQFGPDGSAQTVIGNTAPSCEKAVVLPSAGTTETEFVCHCENRTDPDGDAAQDSCRFENDDEILSEMDADEDGECHLDSSTTARGMSIHCYFTPKDAEDTGEGAQSEPVLVQNALPTKPVVNLTPAEGKVETLFTCERIGQSTDLDGDGLSYETTWWVNGYANAGTTSETATANLLKSDEAGAAAKGGDSVHCEVIAKDGLGSSEAGISNTVVLDNTAPSGGTVQVTPVGAKEGDILVCDAQNASDADGETVTWTYQWSVDGVMVEGQTEATLTSEFFDKGQNVLCIATPSDASDPGEAQSNDKLPIVIQNTLPSLTEVSLDPIETTRSGSFSCVVDEDAWLDADPADSEPELDYAWLTYSDQTGESLLVGQSATSLSAADLDVGEQVFCRVTPKNGDEPGESLDSPMGLVVNEAPTMPEVSLTPQSAKVDAEFTCALMVPSEDADGDGLTYERIWRVNGYDNPGMNAETLLAASLISQEDGQKARGGDVVQCAMRADDGIGLSEWGLSNAVTLENSTPTGGSVTLSPTVPLEGDILSCEASGATDLDSDEVGWQYTFYVQGEALTDVDGDELSSAYFDKGNLVSCEATPTDNEDSGETLVSDTVTVGNTLPSLAQATLSPTNPTRLDTLECGHGGWSDADPSDAEPEVGFAWYLVTEVDGVETQTVLVAESESSLSAAGLDVGDVIICEVTPKNGDDEGESVLSPQGVLGNLPPSIQNVLLSPEEAYADSLLSCAPEGYEDPEDDLAHYSYTWRKDGQPIEGATEPTLQGAFKKGNTVDCTITPNDGYDDGTSKLSNQVMIGNKMPAILAVELLPSYGTICEVYSCQATIEDPDDEDQLLSSYRWEVGGVPLEGQTGATLEDAELLPGDVVQCFVEATDGSLGPAPDFAPLVVPEMPSNTSDIYNTPPQLGEVTLTPTPDDTVILFPGTEFLCSPSGFVDAECEPMPSYIYKWYDGVDVIEDALEATFHSSGYPAGTQLACQVIPFDGHEYGSPLFSNTMVLDNAQPGTPMVALEAPDGADGLATCTLLEEAQDDELLSYEWIWKINDGQEFIGESVLSADAIDHCDHLRCRVEASDGEFAVTSNVATVSLPFGDDCDDEEFCTQNGCHEDGGCDITPLSGILCEDGDLCTWDDTCDSGICESGADAPCDDGLPCDGVETCNPFSGDCEVGTPVVCDDFDACNGLETCDSASGDCIDGTPVVCDDLDACNGVETCDSDTGLCSDGELVVCGVAEMICGDVSCDSTDGECKEDIVNDCCGNLEIENGEQCDDGNLIEDDCCSTGCIRAPTLAPVDVVTGQRHTCILLDDGRVKCWGENSRGQLGLGHETPLGAHPDDMGIDLPFVDLGTDAVVKAISAGDEHTCVLLENGDVKCWGSNQYGELGYGDGLDRGDGPDEMGDALLPIDLGATSPVKTILAARWHSCALFENGKIKCWGLNAHGQLGLGDMFNRGDEDDEMGDALPYVELGTGVVVESLPNQSRAHHVCAIVDGGQVKCWGYNQRGVLGTESNTAPSVTTVTHVGDNQGEMGNDLPYVQLGQDAVVQEISLGWHFSCVLLQDGQVKCWGTNSDGNLGLDQSDNDIGDEPGEMGDALPAIDLGTGFVALQIICSHRHSCVRSESYGVKCWGNGANFVLGSASQDTIGNEPGQMGDNLPYIKVGVDQGVSHMAVGEVFTCAQLLTGELKCWGANGSIGNLGLGTTDTQGDTPEEMGDGLPTVDFGASESCTICGDGIQEYGEACDDENTDGGDGCSPTCTIEPGCGNGLLEDGELCDDGNSNDDDDCSNECVYTQCMSLYFDGVDDTAECGNDVGAISDDPFTIMFWVNLGTSLNNKGIISKGPYGDEAQWFVRFTEPEEVASSDSGLTHHVQLHINQSGNIYQWIMSASPVEVGEWHHIAVQRHDSGMRIYIDGVLDQATDSSPIDCNPTGPLYLGSYETWLEPPSMLLEGRLSELMLYSRELSGAEIQARMLNPINANEESGLEGYWMLPDGVGGGITDMSGHDHHCIAYGASWSNDAAACTPGSDCGDGTCDEADGEDCQICQADCGCNSDQTCITGICIDSCGDGSCDGGGGEDCDTCQADCGCDSEQSCSSGVCVENCGDGTCDGGGGEDCASCQADCGCDSDQSCSAGACIYNCGDGICDPSEGEDCDSCQTDCGCDSGKTCTDGVCVDECENEGLASTVSWYGQHAYDETENPGVQSLSQFIATEKVATLIMPDNDAYPLVIDRIGVYLGFGQVYTLEVLKDVLGKPGQALASTMVTGEGGYQELTLSSPVTVESGGVWVSLQGANDAMTVYGDSNGRQGNNQLYACDIALFGSCWGSVDWRPLDYYIDLEASLGVVSAFDIGDLIIDIGVSVETPECAPDNGAVFYPFEDDASGSVATCWQEAGGQWVVQSNPTEAGEQAFVQTELEPDGIPLCLEGHTWDFGQDMTLSWEMMTQNTAGSGWAEHGVVFLYQDSDNYFAVRRDDNGGSNHYIHVVVVLNGVEISLANMNPGGTTKDSWGDFSITVLADGNVVFMNWNLDGWTSNVSAASSWTTGQVGLRSSAQPPSTAQVMYDDVLIDGIRLNAGVCP